MKTENDDLECCPYCDNPSPTFTDDHIFPQFLGGRRTIRVCRDCNNTFGHTFEGGAARHLKRLQVFISGFGLDLTKVPVVWPTALTIGDTTYDLISGPEGVQYKLSKPTIRRDSEGNITGGTARSVTEVNQIARGLRKASPAKEIEISEAPYEQFDDVYLKVPTSFDSDLYRFATKLVAAVLANFGYRQLISSSGIGAYLHAKGEWQTTPAYCDIAAINKLSPPLSHAVYVELGTPSYGIVVIFGYLKVFVPLLPYPTKKAYLATLDPIDGEERFSEVDPIGSRSVPTTIQLAEMMVHLNEMNRMLMQAANLRGAKRPPKLTIQELNPGPPQFFSQTDSTLRFMFPINKSRDNKD
ncbi:MAG: HNH endonuclease [Chthonomonadales bacterium]